MSDLPSSPEVRKRVILYFHDTRRDERHRWTRDRLLLILEHRRPVLDGEPDRTFVIGGQRTYLAISTAGAHWFVGQHPLWGEHAKIEGAMLFDNLTSEDVHQIVEKFYSGRSPEGCFALYYGRFEFYRPDRLGPDIVGHGSALWRQPGSDSAIDSLHIPHHPRG